ncbi:MAG TPA: GNAT family N-acetyltransferase [Terriglobales bacterium]|nr:GNAT family N-acetyltransferase [Terriglobales bacterium]
MEKIRQLGATDIAAGMELSAFAGWNQTAEDWRMLLRLAPEGCFGFEVEDRLVATTTLICYGKQLGWIGMVLTHPEFRGRGFAKRLLEHVLQRADAADIRTLKLDATEQGKPLYEKYGFKSQQAVERWGAECAEVGAAGYSDFEDRRNLDAKAFGVDRSVLLQALASRGRSIWSAAGFLMTRTGRVASYLGPCVARDVESARDLLSQFTQQQREVKGALRSREPEVRQCREWYWDLLPDNRTAIEIANELGFTPKRQLTRMVRGEGFRGRDELVYAIAGFEIG